MRIGKDQPRTADYGKQVLSRLLAFIVEEGGLQSNPCEGISNLYDNNRADIIWTDVDLAALYSAASPEVCWAARLAVQTGLRLGDLLKVSWSHVGDLAITIKTGKGRGRRTAVIPITNDLRSLLAEIPKRATTILTNSHRTPWQGFSSSWNDTLDRAGLSERNLHFHDLRGTAATKLYRAGLSAREIAEVMGWSENKVERLIDRYVKRDEILRDRIRRMEQVGNENCKTDSKTA